MCIPGLSLLFMPSLILHWIFKIRLRCGCGSGCGQKWDARDSPLSAMFHIQLVPVYLPVGTPQCEEVPRNQPVASVSAKGKLDGIVLPIAFMQLSKLHQFCVL